MVSFRLRPSKNCHNYERFLFQNTRVCFLWSEKRESNKIGNMYRIKNESLVVLDAELSHMSDKASSIYFKDVSECSTAELNQIASDCTFTALPAPSLNNWSKEEVLVLLRERMNLYLFFFRHWKNMEREVIRS